MSLVYRLFYHANRPCTGSEVKHLLEETMVRLHTIFEGDCKCENVLNKLHDRPSKDQRVSYEGSNEVGGRNTAHVDFTGTTCLCWSHGCYSDHLLVNKAHKTNSPNFPRNPYYWPKKKKKSLCWVYSYCLHRYPKVKDNSRSNESDQLLFFASRLPPWLQIQHLT